MILNEIVNYLIFRDFIIPLVIIICCLMGCLIIYVYLELQEEIERLNNDIKVLLKENSNKEKVIIAQNNIIKEVREYIEYQLENLDFEEDTKAKMLGAMVLVLLDKENK